ncbi:MAG: CRISPR-associated helicase Cas3' [Thermoflavifilum sp.]|nr:CRISPR-associated helicase Cas3' [Thermoflavifilum sp.]
MSTIWAKSLERSADESNLQSIRLSQHINDLLSSFDYLKKNDQIAKVINSVEKAIECAIVLHDLGKVDPGFQIRTLKNAGYSPNTPYCNIPHSLFSILWIDKERLKQDFPDPDIYRFIISAVAYHHWRERFFQIITSGNSNWQYILEVLENNYSSLEDNLKEELSSENLSSYKKYVKFDLECSKGLRFGVPFSEYAIPPYQLYWLPKRIEIDHEKKRKWILIAGFLQRCDHYASYCESEREDLKNIELNALPYNEIKYKLKQKLDKDDKDIWQIEKIERNELQNKHVILIAPTGYGKTEFAFLWSAGQKFFYTLPLRSAVNQIFGRAQDVFNNPHSHTDNNDIVTSDRCGLLHSDADVFLLGSGGEEQNSMKVYDLAHQLSHPVMISTGDQFFPYALRPPGYERIYTTFSHSCLIIDEVQAYEPRAAAIIVKFIEDIVYMGGRFLLMTATFPPFVEKEIKTRIGEENLSRINIYEDQKEEFKTLAKHQVEVILVKNNSNRTNKQDFTLPQNEIEKIIEQYKSRKRILVVCNTIEQAQKMYEEIQNKLNNNASAKKLWLLHSRMTLANRRRIEQEIEGEFKNPKPEAENEGKILVATQVVEASLDIDADVLFTEIAPLDALVQRMGRVLRRYGPQNKPDKPKETNVYIWIYQEGLQSGKSYVYDKELIIRTLKCLQYIYKNKDNDNRWENNNLNLNEEQTNSSNKKAKKDNNDITNFTPGGSFLFTEYDKYKLVEALYDFPPEHSYLKKFYHTLDILDAGYMAERKQEAQDIFRKIYDVPIILKPKLDEFAVKIKDFTDKNIYESKHLYAVFKKEVLSEYVIHYPFYKVNNKLTEDNLAYYMVSNRLDDLDTKWDNRLKKWLSGIYVVDNRKKNNEEQTKDKDIEYTNNTRNVEDNIF